MLSPLVFPAVDEKATMRASTSGAGEFGPLESLQASAASPRIDAPIARSDERDERQLSGMPVSVGELQECAVDLRLEICCRIDQPASASIVASATAGSPSVNTLPPPLRSSYESVP